MLRAEDMFHQFKSLSLEVARLGGIVQNLPLEVTRQELADWSKTANDTSGRIGKTVGDVNAYVELALNGKDQT